MDMEWNQALTFSEMVKDPVFLTGEIIQIGAIKLNQTLEVVDSFNEQIAPQYYTELHPKVAEITKLSNRDLVKECDCMKKKTLSVLLFVITFIATYTILCFALPGAKMALGTTTLDRIWVAITCMALFKVVVSLVVASIVGVLPMIVGKRE